MVVDPTLTLNGQVIVYAALSGPHGGLYRSRDTGTHWTLLKAGDATDVVATLKARVAELETELAQAEERSAGHRVDFERERERADQLVTTQDRMVVELEALHSLLRSLLEAAQQAAPPVTSRTPDMARRDMARDDSLAQSMRSLLEAAQAARLEGAQQAARPVTSRTWREMTWSERWRRLRRTG